MKSPPVLLSFQISVLRRSARRAVKDEPEYDRVANYESINDAFMVEEYAKACLIENIQLGPKAYAKAELVETYRDVDLTGAGQRKVEDAEPSIGELRRDAIHAIRDILGTTRTDIELI